MSLTPKSMPPTSDKHVKLYAYAPSSKCIKEREHFEIKYNTARS